MPLAHVDAYVLAQSRVQKGDVLRKDATDQHGHSIQVQMIESREKPEHEAFIESA